MTDATFTRLTVDHLTIGNPQGPCFFLTATGLTMFGARNKLLASLKTEFDYTSLTFHDHNGKERIEIMIDERGLPEINLLDANGKKRLTATVDDEGAPVLQLLDTVGKHRLDLSLIEGETPSLSFHDEKETIRFHLLTHEDQETSMMAFPPHRRGAWHYALSKLTKKGA